MSTATMAVKKNVTLGLLGQPNTGKSTVFNALTGSRQHVGNWPGKTVERKDGTFTCGEYKYTLVDLPGSYSLSANSDEEIVTRDYIVSAEMDLVFALVDASQLERSMFLLADYAGINKPVVVLLNMIDVAKEQGKSIDAAKISKLLGVPVLPIVARTKDGLAPLHQYLNNNTFTGGLLDTTELEKTYIEGFGESFSELQNLLPQELSKYSATWLAVKLFEADKEVSEKVRTRVGSDAWKEIEKILAEKSDGILISSDCKFKWLHGITCQVVSRANGAKPKRSRFDRAATSKVWGKPIAIGIMLLGLVASMVIGMPLGEIVRVLGSMVISVVQGGLVAVGAPTWIISFVCEAILGGALSALAMVAFVFGVSLVFGFIEEVGYMARISYVFDSTMQRLGLQGKAMMPFLMSLGCNIGGVAGTRVLDSWKQRLLAIATSWVVPCAGVWGVTMLMGSTFFGMGGAILVVLSLFAVAILHMVITAKLFGRSLVTESDRCGLIMELPPYHKANMKNLFKFVWMRMKDVLVKALKVIVMVSVVFWLLSWSADGNIQHSIIYTVSKFIEPVTSFFGMTGQLFIAFLSSGLGKEASLGVISVLFSGESANVFGLSMGLEHMANDGLAAQLLTQITKPQALAFMYAFFFNMPCMAALGATASETHSGKWTARIAIYYVVTALILAGIAYRVGLLIF